MFRIAHCQSYGSGCRIERRRAVVGVDTATPSGGHTGTGAVCPVGNYCPQGSPLPIPCPPGSYRYVSLPVRGYRLTNVHVKG